jgi:hypothetical protein
VEFGNEYYSKYYLMLFQKDAYICGGATNIWTLSIEEAGIFVKAHARAHTQGDLFLSLPWSHVGGEEL